MSDRGPHSFATVLVRIEDEGIRRPVHLFEKAGEKWLATPTASGQLPAMSVPELQWETDKTGLDAIRHLLIGQSEASDDFEAVGRHLYELLARSGAAGVRLHELRAADARLRLLLDVRPEDLARLPWELMCHGHKWLSVDVTSPLVRVTPGFPGAATPTPIRWPLRILVVVGSRMGDRVVEAEAEISNLHDAFRRTSGLVDVEFLQQPSRATVRAHYAKLRPHIFHFIGHGDVDDNRGRLFLHDPTTGRNSPWPTSMISADLAGWQPRLAILNACRSTSVEEQEGAWRVADALHGLNVPAVIAMQADIRGEAAAVFTGNLYRQLAQGAGLDVAVTAGRQAITDCSDRRRDFALPTLTASAPPESILRMRFGVSDEVRDHVRHLQDQWKHFVDRTEERRLLWRKLDPEPDPLELDGDEEPPTGALAIVGLTQVGKSELAKWCTIACESHGGNAAYVDFGGDKHVSGLRALQLIQARLGHSILHGETNRQAFTSWTEAVRRLGLEGDDSAVPPPADALENAFSYFGDALRAAAGTAPLLLVLDHVGKVPQEDWRMICDWLLLPIAQRRLSPVRAVVVLSEEQRDTRLTEELQPLIARPVELARFRPRDFTPVVGEYVRSRFDVEHQTLEDNLRMIPTPQREFDWTAVLQLAAFLRGTMDWTAYT
jgi:CHAT domain